MKYYKNISPLVRLVFMSWFYIFVIIIIVFVFRPFKEPFAEKFISFVVVFLCALGSIYHAKQVEKL